MGDARDDRREEIENHYGGVRKAINVYMTDMADEKQVILYFLKPNASIMRVVGKLDPDTGRPLEAQLECDRYAIYLSREQAAQTVAHIFQQYGIGILMSKEAERMIAEAQAEEDAKPEPKEWYE